MGAKFVRHGFDIVNPVAVHAPLTNTVEDSAAGGVPGIEAARRRLESERLACEASLQHLNADLQSLEADRERIEAAVEPAPLARLRLLAGMSAELRTALHAMLGYVQLFRLHGGLDAPQTEWVDAMLGAGVQLLEKVDCAASLADIEAEPRAWVVGDGRPPTVMDAGVAAVTPGEARTHYPPPAVPAPQRLLRVLVVDDVAMNREIAASFLQSAGHAVTLAETGAQAVTAAAAGDFDVILMDVCMPGVDGLEATRRIRVLPGARGSVAVIALTAQVCAENIEACRVAGMNGHLAKPFRCDTLNDAIVAAAADGRRRNGAWVNSVMSAFPAQGNEGQLKGGRPEFAAVTPGMRAGAAPAWIDIVSPWSSPAAGEGPSRHGPREAYILDTQFKLKLTSIGFNRNRRLVDATRRCAPRHDRRQHEFHWLLYTDPAAVDVGVYSSVCDLWRWSGSVWRSIAVPGAHFSPEDMYDQGWRYCGPCIEKTAIVEVV